MENINLKSILKINKIIERDNLSSSYKLALLKGTIFVINKFDHFISIQNHKVEIPFFFLIEEWFFDYLPFVYDNIKQQTNKNRAQILNKNIEYLYQELFHSFNKECEWKEIYALIYYKYHNNKLNSLQKNILLKLFKEIRSTIKNNPMKYIGDFHYEIFTNISNVKIKKFDIYEFGTFSLSEDIYNVFKYFGYNLIGINSIFNRWIEFTNKMNPNLNRNNLFNYMIYDVENVLRNTNEMRVFFSNKKVRCIWSGKILNKFDIDHVIPFSIYFNNDIWNLLPSDKKINNQKSNKIPTSELIEKSKYRIIEYWNLYKENFNYFIKQREIALGKYKTEEEYIEALKNKCDFLINKLGFDYFNYKGLK